MGERDCQMVGSPVGCEVGWRLGRRLGCPVGWPLGWRVGCDVGCRVGCPVGCNVGTRLGLRVGLRTLTAALEVDVRGDEAVTPAAKTAGAPLVRAAEKPGVASPLATAAARLVAVVEPRVPATNWMWNLTRALAVAAACCSEREDAEALPVPLSLPVRSLREVLVATGGEQAV